MAKTLNLRTLKNDIGTPVLLELLSKSPAFLVYPITINLVGVTAFAAVVEYQVAFSLSVAALSLQLPAYYEYAKAKNLSPEQTLCSGIFCYLALGFAMAVLIILAGISNNLCKDTIWLAAFFTTSLVFFLINSLAKSALIFNGRAVYSSISENIFAIVHYSGFFFMLKIEIMPPLFSFSASLTIAALLQTLVLLPASLAMMEMPDIANMRERIKAAINYSLPLLPRALIVPVQNSQDRLLAKFFLGEEMVTIVALAQNQIGPMKMVIKTIAKLAKPRIFDAFAAKRSGVELRRFLLPSITLSGVTLLIIIAYTSIVTPSMLPVLVPLLVLYGLAAASQYWQYFNFFHMLFLGKTQIAPWIALWTLALGFIFGVFAVNSFGAYGLGLAALVAIWAETLLIRFFLRRTA